MHAAPHLALAIAVAFCWAACGRPVVLQTPTQCHTDSDCAAGGSCATDADCAAGDTCDLVAGTCVASCDTFTHMCLRKESCNSDTDCPFGAMCAFGECVNDGPPGCQGDADCPKGTSCDAASGTCK